MALELVTALQNCVGIHFSVEAAQALIDQFPELTGQGTAQQNAAQLVALALAFDLNKGGAGRLPSDLKTWHKRRLMGRFVLQVDEVTNVAMAIRDRYKEAGRARCLKLLMTDGIQQVAAVEERLVPALQWQAAAGFKACLLRREPVVAVTDVELRRGMLMLRPENVVVLGGQVDELERARQGMLQEWAKPPSGRRREGAGVGTFFSQLSRAAWPAASVPDAAAALNSGQENAAAASSATGPPPQSASASVPVAEVGAGATRAPLQQLAPVPLQQPQRRTLQPQQQVLALPPPAIGVQPASETVTLSGVTLGVSGSPAVGGRPRDVIHLASDSDSEGSQPPPRRGSGSGSSPSFVDPHRKPGGAAPLHGLTPGPTGGQADDDSSELAHSVLMDRIRAVQGTVEKLAQQNNERNSDGRSTGSVQQTSSYDEADTAAGMLVDEAVHADAAAAPEQLPVMELKDLAQLAGRVSGSEAPLRARIMAGSVKTLRGPIKFKNDTDNSPLDRYVAEVTIRDDSFICHASLCPSLVQYMLGGAAPAELMLTLQTDPSGRERVRSLFSTVSVFLQKYRGVMDLLVHDAPPVVTALDSAALEVAFHSQ